MNININKELFDKLKILDISTIGSRKYRTHKENSDYDALLIVQSDFFIDDNHTYQFKSNEEVDTDYIICTPRRLDNAQVDGSDMVLYEYNPIKPTYRILKAYLGLAKRDYREYLDTDNHKKKFHAIRCKVIAQLLLIGLIAPKECVKMGYEISEDFVNNYPLENFEESVKQLRDQIGYNLECKLLQY